jgi:hypothetical protein
MLISRRGLIKMEEEKAMPVIPLQSPPQEDPPRQDNKPEEEKDDD